MADRFASTLKVNERAYAYYPIDQIEGAEKLPFSLKVVLENVLRNVDDESAAASMAERIVTAAQAGQAGDEVEFMPARSIKT
jgi:aconitate hydratase